MTAPVPEPPACSSARRSAATVGAPSSRLSSASYSRHATAGPAPGTANGSRPSIRRVGEPRMPHRAASSASAITRRATVAAGRPASASASRCSSTGAFGQPGTARTVSSITSPPFGPGARGPAWAPVVLALSPPPSPSWRKYAGWPGCEDKRSGVEYPRHRAGRIRVVAAGAARPHAVAQLPGERAVVLPDAVQRRDDGLAHGDPRPFLRRAEPPAAAAEPGGRADLVEERLTFEPEPAGSRLVGP